MKNLKKVAVGLSTGLLVSTGSAFAAVPTEVTTALTDAKADAVSVAGTVLTIIIAISAFLYMRRAAK